MLVFGAVSVISSLVDKNPDYLYAIGVLKDTQAVPVINTPEEIDGVVIKPYIGDTVAVKVPFYDIKGDELSQEKALIYFQNTYMKNTGVLYTSEEGFDIVMSMGGTIKKVRNDEILGNVIEVEHNQNLRTIYYSVDDIKVSEGDMLEQSQVIARSGANKICEGKNNLLFEVYYNGVIINPEVYYEMDISTLNQVSMSVYIVDDKLVIINKDRVWEKSFKSIDKGYILNKEKFMEEYSSFLKKEKIKTNILNDRIEIVLNSYYLESDRFYLENIFVDLGYLKVEFKDINEILGVKDKENILYVELDKGYMVVYLDRGIYLDLNFFQDIPKILQYFLEYFDRDIILFGTNKMVSQIKLKDKMVYYIDKPDTYIEKCLLKVKKYGV